MIIVLTLIFLIVDVVSKYIISEMVPLDKSIEVIDNFFSITYVRNTGAAWSIFSDNTILVSIVSLIIILGIIWYVYKNKINNRWEKIAYSLILGGAIGNFIDRILYGYVVDFLEFNIFGYNYPIFNMADTFIVIGVIILIIYTWRCKN